MRSKKRVFLVGAGFSKPAGFPLASELTDEVLDQFGRIVGKDSELFDFVKNIQKLHLWIAQTKEIQPLNIEEFYEYATVFAEIFRAEHHLESVERKAGDTAYAKADSIKNWLSYLDEHLLDSLLEHEDTAALAPISKFVDQLRSGDIVLSFNYDRLIERCLTNRNLEWSLGFDEEQSEITLLKVHGSLDWICFARNQNSGFRGIRRLYSKRDLNRECEVGRTEKYGETEYDFELYRIEDDKSLHEMIQGRDWFQRDYRWGLAGLGPRKRVSAIPGLGVTWNKARQAIYEADLIGIVGFSFSAYDRFAQIEFARVMTARVEHQKRHPHIYVIDPTLKHSNRRRSKAGCALLTRIKSIFRPVTPIAVRHEEFDWTDLDGKTTPEDHASIVSGRFTGLSRRATRPAVLRLVAKRTIAHVNPPPPRHDPQSSIVQKRNTNGSWRGGGGLVGNT